MESARLFVEGPGRWVRRILVIRYGFSEEAAGPWLRLAVSLAVEVLEHGPVDSHAAFVTGDPRSLLAALDVRALARGAGVCEARAAAGLRTVVPALVAFLGRRERRPGPRSVVLGPGPG